jgi:hypothetical protein
MAGANEDFQADRIVATEPDGDRGHRLWIFSRSSAAAMASEVVGPRDRAW